MLQKIKPYLAACTIWLLFLLVESCQKNNPVIAPVNKQKAKAAVAAACSDVLFTYNGVDITYQIKIGGSTYEMRSDGLYDITGGGIRHSSTNSGSKIQGLCFTNKTMTKFFPDTDPDRRYKLKVAIHSIIIRSSAKGKVVSFK